MEKHLTLDFKELRIITIECSHCGTKVTLDVGDAGTKIPASCPSCRQEFDSVSVQSPLSNYKTIFTLLTEIKHKITVQIPIKD